MRELQTALTAVARETVGTNQMVMAINQLSAKVDRISEIIQSNQVETMAKLQEVFAAIEATGVALVQKVNMESAEIVAAIEAVKRQAAAGAVTEADLDTILAKVGGLGSLVGDAVVAMVPSMPTPAAPTAPEAPVVVPTPEPVEVPSIEIPVEITPADLGVPGASSIEAQ